MSGELRVMHTAFHTAFLRFDATVAGHVGSEVPVVDALCGDQGEDEVDDPLEGVDAERGDTGFEVGRKFGSLQSGGF